MKNEMENTEDRGAEQIPGNENVTKPLDLSAECEYSKTKGDNSFVNSKTDVKNEKGDSSDPFDVLNDHQDGTMDKEVTVSHRNSSELNKNERIGSVGSEESSDPSDMTVTHVKRQDFEGNSSDEKSTDTVDDVSTPGYSSSGVSNESPEKEPHGSTLGYSSSVVSNDSPEKESDDGSLVQNGSLPRPGSLSLPQPLQVYEKKRSRSDGHEIMHKSCTNAISIPHTRDNEFENIEETMLSKSMPHGTFLRKGDMIEFVADDLQEKIRRSSPLTKTESSGLSSRTSSIRSISSLSSNTSSAVATSGMSRSPSSQYQQSPVDIPPIDPLAVIELEVQAKKVADSVDLMMGNLRSNLHKMSAITVGCLDAYKKSVDATCDSVDSSIKSMYALMAKCEELSNNMKPVYKLSDQIKEIKRLLDRFEGQLTEKSSKS